MGAILTAITVVALQLVAIAPARAAGPCDGTTNPVVCENSKTGTPDTVWDVSGSGDPSIQGFATNISANLGQTIGFKVNTNASAYTIDIYRLGYYAGNGARKIASVTPSAKLPQSQPACLRDSTTALYDCGNWGVSASWTIPSTAVSGVYIARLTRSDTQGASLVPFIVRDDSSHSQMLFKTSDATWQAYNLYGGSDFYPGNDVRATKISYNRPYATRDSNNGRDFLFANEYPMIRFLESNGYDVSYFTDVDADRSGGLIKNHGTFLSVGHDEYWSGPERNAVEAARDAGVNLAFFSGNESYWKTRWETSIDGSGTPYRTLVCYKETWANAKIDPAGSTMWTGTWRDPRWSPPADGGRPENSMTGQLFMSNDGVWAIQVPAQYAKMRIWRKTSIANLTSGQVATLAPNTLGYEFDIAANDAARPPGLVTMSSTTVDAPQVLQDYGSTVAPQTLTHNISLYRAASGALVFGAGTIQWTWGLDDQHDGATSTPDVRMRQMTVNLFTDMGAQALTLNSDLVKTTASTDTTAPTVSVASPGNGATVTSGSTVAVKGTAADVGGVVGAVEVSTDGGTSWRAATGTTSWTYSWTPREPGSYTLKVRAVDDSVNIGAAVSLGITVAPRPCPCSIWSSTDAPVKADSGDASAVEVGTKFRSEVSGTITGVRFYKSTANTGTHTGSLWTSTGAQLATGTFTGETASGWQTLTFANPVQIQAGVTYVASYHTDSGHYAADVQGFGRTGFLNSPLLALADGVDGPNGVYKAGTSGFPQATYSATNYWVDVVLQADTSLVQPPTVVSYSPAANVSSVATDTPVSVSFNKPVDPSTLTMKVSNGTDTPAGTTSYNSDAFTATFRPSAALQNGSTYTVTVTASDLSGNAMAPYSWSFTTAQATRPPGTCPCSIWSDSTQPTVPSADDSSAVELGVKFRATTDGYITGVRFYKGNGNTGTHTGSLWSSTGTRLATVTFVTESAGGWQEATFDNPVPVTAGTTYVASYHTNKGHYAVAKSAFATSGVTYGPLTALAAGVDGDNGVYKSGTSGFPTTSYSSSNYYVDVVYYTQPPTDTTPPKVAIQSPAAGATGLSVLAPASATFNEQVQAASVVMTLSQGTTPVASHSSYDSTSRTATVSPDAPLVAGTTYTVSVSATDLAGNAMTAPSTWSFTTGTAGTCPCSVFPTTAIPTVADAGETSAAELGMRFVSDVDGYATGVRFYKSTGNTGTHTGSLWTTTGTSLASVTFSNETSGGWQTAMFDAPVKLTAGTVYVVSYHTDSGHFAADAGTFDGTWLDRAPLHAPADGAFGSNGVYKYGTSGFPTSTYGSTSYAVDVVFDTSASDTRPPTVTQTSPTAGATGVKTGSAVTATFSESVRADSVALTLTGGGGSVAGTLTYDDTTHTAKLVPSVPLAYSTTYTANVSATDVSGNAMASPYSWTFTTVAVPTCPCSIWDSSTVPTKVDSGDRSALELGVKFRASRTGNVSGVRFYKSTRNTGTHTGSLWSSTGTLLATGTFTGETASGWQTLTFTSPVAITADTTYVVSYHTDTGYYSADVNYFATNGVTNGPLTALANGADGANGVYKSGASGFPKSTYNATNYWVDVIFGP